MKEILQTERLRLRELSYADTKFIISLLNSPGSLKYIGDRKVKTEEQAKIYLENGPLKSYKDNGYGKYLVERKADDCAIGTCGIIKRDFLQHPDIGYALLPEYTGKGYAYEIAAATMVYAKERLKLKTILAITDPENTHSIALLKKIVMTYIKPIIYPEDDKELLLFKN